MECLYTTEEIENLLRQEEYKPVDRIKYRDLTESEQADFREVQDIVSFGNQVIHLFDTLLPEKGLVPQQEYIDTVIPLMSSLLSEQGIDVRRGHEVAILQRSTATYMSKVVELHLSAMLKDMEGVTEVHCRYADAIMGVDHIISNGEKLLYIHVTSVSNFARKMLTEKEYRGGWAEGSNFIKYNRDFTGDVFLHYGFEEDVATKFVNGFPLFKEEYIEFTVGNSFKSSKKGEYFKGNYTKLDEFLFWMHQVIGKEVTAYGYNGK